MVMVVLHVDDVEGVLGQVLDSGQVFVLVGVFDREVSLLGGKSCIA